MNRLGFFTTWLDSDDEFGGIITIIIIVIYKKIIIGRENLLIKAPHLVSYKISKCEYIISRAICMAMRAIYIHRRSRTYTRIIYKRANDLYRAKRQRDILFFCSKLFSAVANSLYIYEDKQVNSAAPILYKLKSREKERGSSRNPRAVVRARARVRRAISIKIDFFLRVHYSSTREINRLLQQLRAVAHNPLSSYIYILYI